MGSCLTQGHEDFEQGTRRCLTVSTDSSAQLGHALLDVASQGFLHNLVHLLGIGLKVIVDLKIIVRKYRYTGHIGVTIYLFKHLFLPKHLKTEF